MTPRLPIYSSTRNTYSAPLPSANNTAQEQEPPPPNVPSTSRNDTNDGIILTNTKKQQVKTMNDYIPQYLKRYIQPAPTGNSINDDDDDEEEDTDFCMSTNVTSPKLVAYCMMEGFLPMAYSNYILLPKLHVIRSIIPLRKNDTTMMIPIPVIPRTISSSVPSHTTTHPLPYDLHISKNTRKRSNHYYMTINTAFDTVIQHCQKQHGGGATLASQQQQQRQSSSTSSSCWLYPTLLKLFHTIHVATIQQRDGYVIKGTKDNNPIQISIRLYSVEVWNAETNEFAAGEIGYTVGDTIYTSLTGCCVEDSAGSVQMAALGAVLIYLQSFYIWDLGMDMPYKQTLGAQLIPRQEFITLIRTLRTIPETNATTAATPTASDTVDTTNSTTSPTSSLLSSIQWPIQQLKEPIICRDIIDAISTRNHNTTTKAPVTTDMITSTAPLPARPMNKKQRKELKKQSMTKI